MKVNRLIWNANEIPKFWTHSQIFDAITSLSPQFPTQSILNMPRNMYLREINRREKCRDRWNRTDNRNDEADKNKKKRRGGGQEKNGPSRSSTNYALTESLRRQSSSLFLFSEERRSTSILPRPTVFENDQAAMVFVPLATGIDENGSSSACIPLATATWKPVRGVDASRAHQQWRRDFSRNLGFFSNGGKRIFFLEIFTRPRSGIVRLIFHREDPAFKYGVNGPRELLEGGVLFLLDGWLRRGRTDRKRQVVGLMGIQIMFARVIDRVSGFPREDSSLLRVSDLSEIRVMKYRQSLNLWNPIC